MLPAWLCRRRAIAIAALAWVSLPLVASAQEEPGTPPVVTPDVDEPATPDSAPAAPAASTPATTTSEPVQYGAVDAATVRVFAIGAVGVDRFEVQRKVITFATTSAGHGTGFAVGSGQLIATARHVVDGAVHVVVRRPGNGGFSVAHVISESKDADVAILAIEEKIAPLQLADDATALRVRATAFAVGYPLDPTRKFAQSARGIIAGNLDDGTVQLDMDLNPGNSGGPLLDTEDRVIGMVVARAVSDAGAQGIGYAVPIAKVAAAVRKAEAKLAVEGMPPTTAAQRKSATVVDQLIQAGALKSLSDASDLEGGLQGQNLERGLDGISAEVDDPDLLAFISGNVWNASLVLRYTDIEQIGKNKISRAEARRLANRLEREAIKLSKSAYRRDPSVIERSSFVNFARTRDASDDSDYETPPGASAQRTATRKAPRLPVRGWAGITLRVNPDTGTTGFGPTLGAYLELRHTRDDQRIKRVIPVLGGALGTVTFDAAMGGDSFRHTYLSLEVGALVRPSKHFELGGVYAPGLYTSEVNGMSNGAGKAEEFILGHARVWASAVLGKITLSASVRVLSGPTFWLEPITVGFIY